MNFYVSEWNGIADWIFQKKNDFERVTWRKNHRFILNEKADVLSMNDRWMNNELTICKRQINNGLSMNERWINNEWTMNQQWIADEWTMNQQRIVDEWTTSINKLLTEYPAVQPFTPKKLLWIARRWEPFLTTQLPVLLALLSSVVRIHHQELYFSIVCFTSSVAYNLYIICTDILAKVTWYVVFMCFLAALYNNKFVTFIYYKFICETWQNSNRIPLLIVHRDMDAESVKVASSTRFN